MSAGASLERFGERDLVFIKWDRENNVLKNEWTLKPCFMKVHSNQTMGSFYMVFYVHRGDLVNENPFLPFSII